MNNLNAWNIYTKDEIFDYCDNYINFLNKGKTERLCVEYFKAEAEKNGFINIDDATALKTGDKIYKINRNKSIALAVIGQKDISDGTNIIASHIDSPRLDLKPNPLYEDSNLALFKTHYYGGIKKYQWVSVPMSLIGVVVLKDGSVIDVNIGENAGDPVLTISDLLIHLASEQMGKKASEVIGGEDLNLIIGSIPDNCEKDKFKSTVLNILKDKYGFEEDDFSSAELEAVPSFKATCVGLDRSMIGAYGQDDRVCAYTSYTALLNANNPERTSICMLADKEEIGSMGTTGMEAMFFDDFIIELIYKTKGEYNHFMLRNCLSKSYCLSADVAGATDPTFKSVMESSNASYFGGGIALVKYTGARGKSSASDANAEYVAKIRGMLDKNNIPWQICELGKVDAGGGGTVAKFIANKGADTLDCGVPVLSMHSPFELTSKADVYATYNAYKAFYEIN